MTEQIEEEVEKKQQEIVKEIEEKFPDTFEIYDEEYSSDASIRILKEGRRLNQKDVLFLFQKISAYNELSQFKNLSEKFFPKPVSRS